MTRMIRSVPPLLALLACGTATGRPQGEVPPDLDAEPAVEYPTALYERGVSGSVELRLFVDSTGAVAPDSIVLSRSSGHPAFDSAALAAAPRLRYTAGTRNGSPAGMAILQAFHFRHPGAPESTP